MGESESGEEQRGKRPRKTLKGPKTKSEQYLRTSVLSIWFNFFLFRRLFCGGQMLLSQSEKNLRRDNTIVLS